MADQPQAPSGPDLSQGVPHVSISDGAMLGGHVGDDPVLLARVGKEIFAVGAVCAHYSGPLAEGLLVGDTVRCPWHHACFSLRTGFAIRPPALNDLPRWRVELRAGQIFVREKLAPAEPLRRNAGQHPTSILILGA